jgi:hypothetical protein
MPAAGTPGQVTENAISPAVSDGLAGSIVSCVTRLRAVCSENVSGRFFRPSHALIEKYPSLLGLFFLSALGAGAIDGGGI